ncbi:MAG: hypothetical protein K0U72_11750 [Gammaproteobacteria bacterium]|nr:hypothetical protein [Gammaproteobacteria bacterium]
MNKALYLSVVLAFTTSTAIAEDAAEVSDAEAEPVEEAEAPVDTGPKKMSGMSILGNEETPKSLVIVPWKSSEMGDDIGLSDSLADRAQPVDKEVFLRELEYYEIRSAD